MQEPKRTPGQAEGTPEEVDNALDKNDRRRREKAAEPREREHLQQEPGRTPEQAEGTEEQADGSLRNQ